MRRGAAELLDPCAATAARADEAAAAAAAASVPVKVVVMTLGGSPEAVGA